MEDKQCREVTIKSVVETLIIHDFNISHLLAKVLANNGYEIVSKPLHNKEYQQVGEELTIYQTITR